jgi:Zn-dependent peptidase ImmA (M78 family)
MNAGRRQEIELLAESVRRACGSEVPVDVEGAVTRLGGCLRTVPVADHEAKIEKRDSAFLITLTEDRIATRQRFSIAHELGHLFLHMGYAIDEAKWQEADSYSDSVYYRYGYTEEEYEANEFAGALLMPRAEFERVAGQYRVASGYSINPIADHFLVSREAAIIRGRWLGLFAWE